MDSDKIGFNSTADNKKMSDFMQNRKIWFIDSNQKCEIEKINPILKRELFVIFKQLKVTKMQGLVAIIWEKTQSQTPHYKWTK